MKYVLITTIKTSLLQKDVMKVANSRAKHFSVVQGLLRKLWTYDEKQEVYHGIFEFSDEASAKSYLKTAFAIHVAEAYKTIMPVKVALLKIIKDKKYL